MSDSTEPNQDVLFSTRVMVLQHAIGVFPAVLQHSSYTGAGIDSVGKEDVGAYAGRQIAALAEELLGWLEQEPSNG